MSSFDLGKSLKRARERFQRPGRGAAGLARKGAKIPNFSAGQLPLEVRDALYNLGLRDNPNRAVPGDQIAFYCFNYGSPRAMSFAAGLPTSCLRGALGRPGFRPKSRALLEAVLKFREDE